MQVPLSDGGYIVVPVTAPTDIPDITVYPVHIAMLVDGPGEPVIDDYVSAIWLDGQAATTLAAQLITTAGRYKLWVKVTTSQETKVLPGPVIGGWLLMIVYISAGNSDDKLSQGSWATFQTRIGEAAVAVGQVHGFWFSAPMTPYQNMCICVELANPTAVAMLKTSLEDLAKVWRQDSIAWAEAPLTEFLRAE